MRINRYSVKIYWMNKWFNRIIKKNLRWLHLNMNNLRIFFYKYLYKTFYMLQKGCLCISTVMEILKQKKKSPIYFLTWMKFRLKFRNNVTDQCMWDFYNVMLFFNFKNIYNLARWGILWCWFYAFHFIISESYYFITLFH